MRGALLVAFASLAASCGARTALDDQATPAETGASTSATTSVYSTSFTATATTVNAVCKGGDVLCHQCDGGAYCAAGCPLTICPIDVATTPSPIEAGAPCGDGGSICNYVDCNGSPQSYCVTGPCMAPFYDCPGGGR